MGDVLRHRYYDPATEKVVPKDAVVLDLDEAYGCWAVTPDPAKIVSALRGTNSVAAHAIARQIEAQTKPRIPEPETPLAEIEASTGQRERRRFIRGFGSEIREARWVDGVASYSWRELIDPVLIREGVES